MMLLLFFFLVFSKQNKGIFPAVRGIEIACDYAGGIVH